MQLYQKFIISNVFYYNSREERLSDALNGQRANGTRSNTPLLQSRKPIRAVLNDKLN